MEYNFFDYDTDHPDLSVYDIHQCYSPRQSEELVIVFPGESNIHCETFEIWTHVYQPYVKNTDTLFMRKLYFRLFFFFFSFSFFFMHIH